MYKTGEVVYYISKDGLSVNEAVVYSKTYIEEGDTKYSLRDPETSEMLGNYLENALSKNKPKLVREIIRNIRGRYISELKKVRGE